jgi:hypothetical protein
MSRRTTTSTWVYRITIGLLILGAIKVGQMMWDLQAPFIAATEGPAYAVAMINVSATPLSLLVGAAAMFLRSGAVVWLLGTHFVFTAMTMLAGLSDNRPILALTTAIVVCLFVLGALLFAYLIRKEELRRP